MTSKPVVVAGQTAAFTALEKIPPKVMTGHAGTDLDPTWTEAVGEGFYDQSQRMYQAPLRLGGDTIYILSVEFAMLVAKVDWVEAIGPAGDCWRITVKRLMDEGFGVELLGVRFLGAPAASWEHIPMKGRHG